MHDRKRFSFGRHLFGEFHPAMWLSMGGRGGHDSRDWMGRGHGMGGHGGGAGMMRGRKFSADEVQLMLLSVMEEQPRHGYELIKELESRSNGFYSPSPGVVYPALSYLEELDYTTVETVGTRKRHHIAALGRDYLTANRERVDMLFAGLQHAARKMTWMKQAWSGENGEEAAEASGWLLEFVEARRALKQALLRRTDADATEQRRIAAILRQAATDISGGEASAPGAD
jgi:DNA-binding PadR family transcriptional regulator